MERSAVHLRMPKGLVDYFTNKANEQGVPRTTLIIQALWEKKENEQKNR